MKKVTLTLEQQKEALRTIALQLHMSNLPTEIIINELKKYKQQNQFDNDINVDAIQYLAKRHLNDKQPPKPTITYDIITENQFNEFLSVLKQIDPTEYLNESQDNFHDLYRYWNDIAKQPGGRRRFNQKLLQNQDKLNQL